MIKVSSTKGLCMKKTVGMILITNTPSGEAPLWVRSAWVGLHFPCDSIKGFAEGEEVGAITKSTMRKRYGYHVPQSKALDILQIHSPDAASWWRRQGYPNGGYFCFDESEARVISNVTDQTIVEVPEEAMGCLLR